MKFVWAGELERNRVALSSVLASLLAMAGLLADGTLAPRNIGHDTMPRRFYLRILQLIKPAESALRRLVFTMARAITVKVRVRAPQSPSPVWGGVRGGGQIEDSSTPTPAPIASHAISADPPHTGEGEPRPLPRRSLGEGGSSPWKGISGWAPTKDLSTLAAMTLTLSLSAPRPSRQDKTPPAQLAAARVPPRGNAPLIPLFPLFDPCIRFDRRTWIQAEDFAAYLAAKKPRPVRGPLFLYEEVDSSKIIARVLAFKAALDDIPAQALRLARLQARRRANANACYRRTEPLRRSPPPGWLRHRRRYPRFSEEERILRDCNALALWARAQNPDTS